MGHTHVLSGLAAGLATLPSAPVTGAWEQAGWVAAWGGMAMLPDLDQPGSRVGRLWGPVTDVTARLVSFVARGHRWGTHDPVLGTLAFGALAYAAAWYPVTSAALLALAIGLALRGLHFAIPGRAETTALGNAVLSALAAGYLIRNGYGAVDWLPTAVMGGVLVHQLGDLITRDGLPVPVLWVLNGSRVKFSPIKTGRDSWAERAVAAALAFTCVALLAEHTGTLIIIQEAISA